MDVEPVSGCGEGDFAFVLGGLMDLVLLRPELSGEEGKDVSANKLLVEVELGRSVGE